MKKIILISLILLAGAYIGLSFIVSSQQADEVPSKENAPYLVQTVSRVYYAKLVTGNGTNLTMTGYYYRDHNRWVFVSRNFTFDKGFNAKMVRR